MDDTKPPLNDASRCPTCGGLRHPSGLCPVCFFALADLDVVSEPRTDSPEIQGYRLLRQIGRGGMGVVWLAEHAGTRRQVAVKVLAERTSSGENPAVQRARFEREIELSARLRHPNIARVYDGGVTHDACYFAMEFVDGVNLADFVQQHSLKRREIIKLMRKVCDAVQHAHQNGIIHRDLKPSNILVTSDGEPKVLDFGLAKVLGGTEGTSLELSLAGQLIGTPRYMAPEQVRGEAVDTRTDVYALGVILCELLTGEHPHESTGSREAFLHRIATDEPRRPRMLCRDLNSELEMLLLKALSKNPDERYRTAGGLADDFGRWLRNESLVAGRATPLYFARRWARRHMAAAMTALTVAGAMSGVGWYAWEAHRQTAIERKLREAAENELRRASETFASKAYMVWDTEEVGETGSNIYDVRITPSAGLTAKHDTDSSEYVRRVADALGKMPDSTPEASPAPARPSLLKEEVSMAQKLEEDGKWIPALDAWLKIARNFPESGVGKNHLETLLNHLRDRSSPITFEEFTAKRGQITEAAQLDILSAMMLIGDNLRTAEPTVAFNWFSAAAAKGDAGALTQLGFLLSRNRGPVKADLVKAAEYFQAAADKGDTGGKFAIGQCYITGHGLPGKDEKRGAELLREASDAGDSRAMNSLGDCYAHGTGVKVDFNEAFKLFSHAAEKGNLWALANLGVVYMTGRGVPTPDPKKGAEFFEKGARAGNSAGMFGYAQCLEGGIGVGENGLQAQAWYRKAAEAGDDRAIDWCQKHNVPFTPA